MQISKRHQRRALFLVIVLLGIAGVFLLARVFVFPSDAAIMEREFKRRLNDAFLRGDSAVRVSTLTDFPWERVCVVSPYAVPELYRDEERKLLAAKGAFDAWWVGREGSWGLVFGTKAEAPIAIHIYVREVVLTYSPTLLRKHRLPVENEPRFCLGAHEATLFLITTDHRRHAYFGKE